MGLRVRLIDPNDVGGVENLAMLQALYSRSGASVDDHLEELRRRGSSKFMEEYYVGYDHASIGDCASGPAFFIEGISFLAAKAIQDYALYSGQETSTRYVFLDRIEGREDGTGVGSIEQAYAGGRLLHQFYIDSYEEQKDYVRQTYGSHLDLSTRKGRMALHAATCDVLRGFLPAGLRTQLSWCGSLRNLTDGVRRLHSHPLDEVRKVAGSLFQLLLSRYPSSTPKDIFEMSTKFNTHYIDIYEYPNELEIYQSPLYRRRTVDTRRSRSETIDRNAYLGVDIELIDEVDYGSFRDIQRHRALHVPIPLLTRDLDFEDFYFSCLSPSLKEKAEKVLREAKKLSIPDLIIDQYNIPLGQRCKFYMKGPLHAWIYFLELRSGRTVHHTVRQKVFSWSERFEKELGINLFLDKDPSMITMKRGGQTIGYVNSV